MAVVAIPAPMLASPGGKPFTSADWLYELKYDGYRCLARFGDGGVELRTKRGVNCTLWFPEVVNLLAGVTGGPHIIDAEACVLDDIGRSDFALVSRKAMLAPLLGELRKKLVLVGDFPAEAELFEQLVMGAKLEGFVAKRKTSPYQPGVVSSDWLKIKRPGWQEGRTWRS